MKKFEDMTNDEKEILISSFLIGYKHGELVGLEYGTSGAAEEIDGIEIGLTVEAKNAQKAYDILRSMSSFIDNDGCFAALNRALSE